MKYAYDHLVHTFCELTGIAKGDIAQRVAQGEAIEVDDIVFAFGWNEADPTRIQVYADYGEIPEGQKLESYRTLLEANLVLYDSDAAVFAIVPETGRVMAASRFELASITAKELLDAVAYIAERAKAWRSDLAANRDGATPPQAWRPRRGIIDFAAN